ncbi:MAG: hypothetical protein GX121_09270 [Ignavibacteria bacterium]|jgi:hypothetical protein|nr:hypothetical protein [Ignavibacteria bacterium]
MKKLALSSFAILLISLTSAFALGDTIHIRTHDREHLDWHGHFVQDAFFPTSGESFRKIWLDLTIGCPDGGCSPWDYTVCLLLEKNIEEQAVDFELGRFITPYSGNLTSTWSRTYRFDITDFAPLLIDSAKVDVFYDGWSDGFTATLDFIFVKGTAARKAFKVEKLVYGNFEYGNAEKPIGSLIGEKTISIDENTKNAALRTIITGHGFGGNENCAEFCKKDNFIFIDQEKVATNRVWKDDCGMNPHYPQPGTWLYDRANWCPGLPVVPFFNEITNQVNPGEEHTFFFDMTPFVNIDNNNCSYYISSSLILYEDIVFENNAAIEEIIAPSNKWEFSRKNPSCLNPEIIISNQGSNVLNSLEIEYGVPNKEKQKIIWNGNLNFNEKENVVLPVYPLSREDEYFQVEISNPNNSEDENPEDNIILSNIKPVKYFPNKLIFELLTNKFAYENYYEVKNAQSEIIHQRRNLQSSTYYRDTVDLPDGCYEFKLFDLAKNGLYWQFYSEAGAGSMLIMDEKGGLLERFNPDFGTELFLQFQTGPTPKILLSSDTIDFGKVNINEEKELILDIEPANSLGAMIYEVKLNMIGKKGFSILRTEPEFADSLFLQENEKMQIALSFLPLKAGYVESNLQIMSNDPVSPSAQIKLRAEGVDPQSVYDNYNFPNAFINTQSNPISKPTQIEFGIDLETDRIELGTLLLYNPIGELIDVLFEGQLNPYLNTIDILPEKYPRGAYILVLRTNSSKVAMQILIL